MPVFARKLTAAAIATSLLAVPTGAIAAAPAAPRAAAATASASNSWVKLSAMTSTSSSAATAAAAQDYDGEGPGFPPIAPLVVILGTIALAVYIMTKDDESDLDLPVSPN
ncbi:MAG TPA: hypothetical protein VEB39_06115 [Sphingomicrobium sp.]|nr:hypothetical protein [Sphingomicrobium sp.]